MGTDARKQTLTILDGGMGTVLQQRGVQAGRYPEMLNLVSPEIIAAIHQDYIAAGSQIIYTNTFGANRLKLAGCGHSVEETVTAAVANAKKAAAGQAKVALDIGPIGQLLEPLGSLSFEEAVDIFAEMVRAGREADCIIIETMADLYEAKAALMAAKENSDLPVWVTMSFEANGRTYTGCTAEAMARTLTALGADAIGVNCSLGPDLLSEVVREIALNTTLPVIAKPNAGLPDPVTGKFVLSPEDFAEAMKKCVAAGATILGGCCGTSPAYIQALCQAVEQAEIPARTYDSVSFVCTPTKPLRIEGVRVIGERINPTGKKRFQQALLEQDLDFILELGIQQMDAGAEILDVNVGYPGVDEEKMLPLVVKKLQSAVELPLMLDSSNPAALAAALRVYNGKPAVNSVNGDAASQQKILPLVKRYGAAVVGLALDSRGIPQTAAQRVEIAQNILRAAEQLGIPKEDVWIDCLTLTVSAQQDQVKETLEAVRRVHQELRLKTVLGVSNISFGLPYRSLVSQCFLAEAMAMGLDLPIINPNQREMMELVEAHQVLSGEDQESKHYIEKYAGNTAPAAPVSGAAMSLEDAIVRGLKSEAGKAAKTALAAETELSIVEKHLIPALDQVGAGYEKGTMYLPQLLSAAQAAQAVFEVIRQAILEKGGAPIKKGRLAIATVKGDIHDIGKNIVKTVIENYGYQVLDLGKDVPPEEIVRAAQKEQLPLIGLTALMTTTLPAMEETIRQLKALPDPPAVMVGGAVVTPDYAQRIGADYYAKDAREAVEIVRKVIGA